MKRTHRDVIPQFFPVTTCKIKETGENREVQTESKNYTLPEIQTFLKDLMNQEGSDLLLTAIKMHQLTSISQDLRIHNLLKDSFRLYACFF